MFWMSFKDQLQIMFPLGVLPLLNGTMITVLSLLSTRGAHGWRRTPALHVLRLGSAGMDDFLESWAPGWSRNLGLSVLRFGQHRDG